MNNRIFLVRVICVWIVILLFTGHILAAEQPFKGETLKILGGSDDIKEIPIYGPMIPVFEEETGINVELVKLGQHSIHDRAITIFVAKSPEADLTWSWAADTAEYANAGYLEDITDWLTEEEWSKFVPGALNASSYQGRRYGMPIFFSIRSFMYNKKLFREAGLDPDVPPKTWDEFVEYAQKITNPDEGKYGILHDYGINNSLLINFQEHLVLTGGRIVDNDNNIMFNNEEGILALEKIVELNKLGVVDPASFGITTGPDKRARWIMGHDGMSFGWSADYVLAQISEESKLRNEIGLGLIPSINNSGAITGSESFVMSKFSKKKEVAFEFLKFISREDIQKEMTLRTGWYPTKKALYDDAEILASSPLVETAGQQSQYPTYRFAAPYAAQLTDILGPELLAAILGEKTPKQALDDAARVLEPILADYK